MAKWSNSEFAGPTANNWPQGQGKFKFPNGVVYEGDFDKGEFHGNGTLHYPNGGRYVGKWNRGKSISGDYFFYDDLPYENRDWTYSTQRDRSFYTEVLMGIRPDGKTLIVNNIDGPRLIPQGCYDIGDGFYDPTKRMICNYDGAFKRNMETGEEEWIVSKCRYNPTQYEDPTILNG